MVAVIIILGGLAFVFFYWYEGNGNVNDDNLNQANTNFALNLNQNQNLNLSVNTNANNNTNSAIDKSKEKNEIIGMAHTFAERFGSYSNKNDFENLENLKSWMTSSYQKDIDSYIEEQEKIRSEDDDYKAMVSKVISNKITNFSDESARVELLTERTEEDLTDTLDNYYQKLVLELKKIDNTWKINAASWGEKSDL
ncbi:MAG: hypothetical protein U5L76_00065 [Patescibacteria group bacterium]|nr:hypothetical protein [Patescibacteria group bacterium]MDZ7797997.1 hypothetical protein [Patescibacteria group bacterium]